MKRDVVWTYVLVLLAGAAAGYVDLHNDEVQACLILMLPAGFFAGLLQPRGAWRWALVLGLGVPVAHLVARLVGYRPPYPVRPNDFAVLLALIPAFVATYAGVAARWFAGAVGEAA